MRSALPVLPDDRFRCEALACWLRARVCVRRQIEVERDLAGDLAPGSSRRKRGIGPQFPACWRCRQGAAIRRRLGDDCATEVRTGDRGPEAYRVLWAALRELPPGEPMTIDHLGGPGPLQPRRGHGRG